MALSQICKTSIGKTYNKPSRQAIGNGQTDEAKRRSGLASGPSGALPAARSLVHRITICCYVSRAGSTVPEASDISAGGLFRNGNSQDHLRRVLLAGCGA